MDINVRSRYARNRLIIVLLIVGFIVIGWFLVKPAWGDLNTTKENLVQAQIQLDAKKATSQNVVKLLSNFEAQRFRLEILDDALPNSPEIPQLLSGLEELVSASGMNISVLKITEERGDAPAQVFNPAASGQPPVEQNLITRPELGEIKIELAVTGTPENFYLLLSLLERNLRLLDINIISLSSEAGGAQGEAIYDLVISTFYKIRN